MRVGFKCLELVTAILSIPFTEPLAHMMISRLFVEHLHCRMTTHLGSCVINSLILSINMCLEDFCFGIQKSTFLVSRVLKSINIQTRRASHGNQKIFCFFQELCVRLSFFLEGLNHPFVQFFFISIHRSMSVP
ncbi:unnamed protein product [Albugo candida]|uniref:Uncharacterized protein n=1 Tax=Albugo candida TaxID=65357 RepID=A0A024GTQ2_9STRA|nr:unnamed protein product [Albugo candida]|eukprot:CCI50190.1 unnamed protein product [Albugo candida]